MNDYIVHQADAEIIREAPTTAGSSPNTRMRRTSSNRSPTC